MPQDDSHNPFSWLRGGILKGVKLGPGALGNLAMVAVAVCIGAGIITWALRGDPLMATIALVLLLTFGFYVVERSFRFAEKHPAAALMGDTVLYHYLRDQAAKDKSIVIDAPIVGAGPATISHQAGHDDV